MNNKEYQNMSEKELAGRKVRSLVTLRNGMGLIRAGTILEIRGKHAGLSLQSEPCPRCGLRASITKVPPQDVELLPVGLKEVKVEPGSSGFCLVKVPRATLEGLPADQVKGIEALVGMPTLIIGDDVEVFIDNAAIDESTRLLDEINAALKRT